MKLHTHSHRLERWLGTSVVEGLSASMRNWYGPPILVSNVPGFGVWATRGGDFIGAIDAGGFASAVDFYVEKAHRVARAFARSQRAVCNMGFADYQTFVQRADTGRQEQFWSKSFPSGSQVGNAVDLWYQTTFPVAGSAGAAAPGGTVGSSSTTGAMKLVDAGSGQTQHFIGAQTTCNISGGFSVLLYDRLFMVAKTMNSTATEAVTGVPTRYQNTSPGNDDYIAGNFMMVSCTATTPSGAHNWTVCQYTNQAGTTGQSFPSFAGFSNNSLAFSEFATANQWYAYLAPNDTGVMALTQMQCDTLVASGGIDFILGHPIAFIPCSVQSGINVIDGVRRAFTMTRVFDGACLALLAVGVPGTGTAQFTGNISLVCG